MCPKPSDEDCKTTTVILRFYPGSRSKGNLLKCAGMHGNAANWNHRSNLQAIRFVNVSIDAPPLRKLRYSLDNGKTSRRHSHGETSPLPSGEGDNSLLAVHLFPILQRGLEGFGKDPRITVHSFRNNVSFKFLAMSERALI